MNIAALDADISARGGRAAVVEQARMHKPKPDEDTATVPKRYKLLSVADLHAMPPMRWRVHSVLPAEGYAAIYGPSGSGKSFLVIDMIAAIANGSRWFGYLVKPASVLYVVLEGQAGVPNRIKAWESANEREFPHDVRFLFESFKLTARGDVLALAASIEAAGGAEVVVIDTLNRAAPDADENSSEDMGCVLEAVKQLQAMVGGLVVLVHHTGKVTTKGMRGHSSLFAAMDGAIETGHKGDSRSMTVAKVKDGAGGQRHPFHLRSIELGTDCEGEAITSCVVDAQIKRDADLQGLKLPRGANQRTVLAALKLMLNKASPPGQAGVPSPRACLTRQEAIAGTRAHLDVPTERRTERAQTAIDGLLAAGVLEEGEGLIWLT